ncbi:protein phosphatase 2C domain-containing protein [Wenjunlia tyrosinilytica]|uniref:PPM-type phosphatase domain-containing protein n=1 Tax=Wenjunlia tyrosinilytica TaxID=1544741 RepID=A0A918E0A1_9ACTN|nr:protein phosphatase 2C domain-containing protein [Wenjunlia tyrosinilytica]GGO92348.1 hypothetical protein GCM10012280_42320 [Wenjunlia tyrosinilytica]
MSQQGDPHHGEDEWWQQLYGAAQRDTVPEPGQESVDKHFDAVRTVMDGGRTTDGDDHRGDDLDDLPDDGLHDGGVPDDRSPDDGLQDDGLQDDDFQDGDLREDGFPDTPPGPVPEQRTDPYRAPATLRLRTVSAPQGQDPGRGRDAGQAHDPGRGQASGPAAGKRPPPAYVGDRPPTYAPEPTAWPAADPEDMESLTPDTVVDGAQYGPLTLRAASVRGDSARYRGQPRRDAMLTVRFGEGDSALLLLAVACGERTGEDSHLAAREACRWIASAVGRHSDRLAEDIRAARRGSLKSGLQRLTDRCLGQLRLRARELGFEPEEYTAGLRCLLLPADRQCRTRVFFGVGDGGLFRLRDGEWQDLDPVRDPRAEETGGEVHRSFRFRASVGRPGDALLLCTQGLASVLRAEPDLVGLLAERWSGGTAPGLVDFLRDTQIRAKGYADDRTSAAAWEA